MPGSTSIISTHNCYIALAPQKWVNTDLPLRPCVLSQSALSCNISNLLVWPDHSSHTKTHKLCQTFKHTKSQCGLLQWWVFANNKMLKIWPCPSSANDAAYHMKSSWPFKSSSIAATQKCVMALDLLVYPNIKALMTFPFNISDIVVV